MIAQRKLSDKALDDLARNIKQWGKGLGFAQIGISDVELSEAEAHLGNWLQQGFHGEMDYMQKHGSKRSRPGELVPGTVRSISVRLDYAPTDIDQAEAVLHKPALGYVSRYALGRDYHKVLRNKLQRLATQIETRVGQFGYRAFTDSAPVLEKALAEKAGLGWIGKHSNLLDSRSGSWFFLGELLVDIPLPVDSPSTNHCGTCQKCIDICPTQAIVAPYQVDARRCISYLTIELRGAIPVEFRRAIGNRIYGCDDCQIICPWNKFAQTTQEPDFSPRAHLQDRELRELFAWTESEFLQYTEGTAIRRIGYACWLRNIAVALGNSPPSAQTVQVLKAKRDHVDDMVAEHIDWALQEQATRASSSTQL